MRNGVVRSGKARNLILAIRLSSRRQPFYERVLHPLSRSAQSDARHFRERKLTSTKGRHSKLKTHKMHHQIPVLLFTLGLAMGVHSDQSLKCYMCTSLTSAGCDMEPEPHKLEPVECTLGKMSEFQRTIQQHSVLSSVASIFEIDNLQSHQAAAPKDMACAKMVLKIADQDVALRSCQTAKTETIDPCKAIEGKLPGEGYELKHCDLCMSDACNHSMAPSPRSFVVIFSAIGALALGILYRAA